MSSVFANGRTFHERLFSRLLLDPSGCLIWTGCRTADGYGLVRANGRPMRVHRVMWELFEAPIPEGLQMDHLCRNRACANVAHLEPVTQRENLLRGDTVTARLAAVTHCPYNHEYTPENTRRTSRGSRGCRKCDSKGRPKMAPGYNGNSADWTSPDPTPHQPQGNVTKHGPGQR